MEERTVEAENRQKSPTGPEKDQNSESRKRARTDVGPSTAQTTRNQIEEQVKDLIPMDTEAPPIRKGGDIATPLSLI